MPAPVASYREFWPIYLREHSKPLTRGLHIAGTIGAMGLLAYGLATMDWRVLVVAPLCGYGPAWVGHFFVEHNKPTTMTYPLWSFVSDLRMVGLFLAGRLRAELERAASQRDEKRYSTIELRS